MHVLVVQYEAGMAVELPIIGHKNSHVTSVDQRVDAVIDGMVKINDNLEHLNLDTRNLPQINEGSTLSIT